MIESLEDRALFSASPMGGALMTTTPPPSGSGGTTSQLVVVQGSQTPVTRPNVVIAIIAILIG